IVNRLLPFVADLDTGGFWDASRRGQLAVPVCDGCDPVLPLPRAYCHRCGSWEGRWMPVSGRASLYSWTTVVHQVHPAFRTPYTIVLVELVDHPDVRLVGHLEGEPSLHQGQLMEPWFEKLED